MLGKKKKKIQAPVASSGRIQVIPLIFYAGKNPTIYEGELAKKRKKTSTNGLQHKSRHSFSSRKRNILVGSGVGVLLLLLITLYTLYDSGVIGPKRMAVLPTEQTEELRDSVVEQDPIEEDTVVSSSTEDIPEEDTFVIVSSTDDIILEEEEDDIVDVNTLSFPGLLFLSGIDLDEDGLTDVEELFFETDPAVWDTDTDGYNDGQEVGNLYNPRVPSQKLIDSGLIQEYIQPNWQYRFYYPNAWEPAGVDPLGEQVLLSILTGEYISIDVVRKNNNESLLAWFSREAVGERYANDYEEIQNQFQVPVLLRRDGLVAMVDRNDVVFVMTYQYNNERRVRYPSVMNLLVQSFRPRRTIQVVADQVPLPGVTATDIETSTTSTVDTGSEEDDFLGNISDNQFPLEDNLDELIGA